MSDATATADVQEVTQGQATEQVTPEILEQRMQEAMFNDDLETFSSLEEQMNNLVTGVQPAQVVQETTSNPEVVDTGGVGSTDGSSAETSTELDPEVLNNLKASLGVPVQPVVPQQPVQPTQPVHPVHPVQQVVQQPQVQQPVHAQQQPVTEIPVRPLRPDVSRDPVEWTPEQAKLMEKYQEDLDTYDINKTAYFENKLNEVSQWRQQQEQQNQIQEQQRVQSYAEQTFWNDVRQFQNESDKFKTSRDILDIHKDLEALGGTLVTAMGIRPNGADPASMQMFQNQKSLAVSKLMEGDPDMTAFAKSAGIELPEGTDVYRRINEVVSYRAQAIDSKILGQEAPLQSAYLNMLASRGELNKAFDSVAANAQQQALQSKANVIENLQQTVKTPTAHGVQGPSKMTTVPGADQQTSNMYIQKGISAQDAQFHMNIIADPGSIDGNLAAYNRFDEIDKKLNT